ncbi:hypothetical protein DDE20_11565 [Pararhodobacter oceanensis]|uniref:Uncharacterized protein n=1 Tax=Pararhodobacter oceanensis TaxID=2172121 RepID=A0A2T8HTY1_9RHOB|nr:hypothetical protein DDE20_11565 [Pararhodobacter oceanensis]
MGLGLGLQTHAAQPCARARHHLVTGGFQLGHHGKFTAHLCQLHLGFGQKIGIRRGAALAGAGLAGGLGLGLAVGALGRNHRRHGGGHQCRGNAGGAGQGGCAVGGCLGGHLGHHVWFLSVGKSKTQPCEPRK